MKISIVNIEEANQYFDERFDSGCWFALNDSEKFYALCLASKKLNYFDFVGEKTTPEQYLAFPRDYAIPQDIKDAVCEEAYTFVSKCINSKNAVHLLKKWMKRDCKKQIAQGE